MKTIILNAGIGKRLLPLTKDKPKCLIKLDNSMTILDLQLQNFIQCELNDIIMLTGIVSNCEVHINAPNPEDRYYYNSSLAHCVYYGSSLIPECEKHLHGEIVAFGVLCLLAYDNQLDEMHKILAFNKSVGLPVTMDEIGLTEKDLPIVAKKAASVIEWDYAPGMPTEEEFIKAIKCADTAGKNL